MPIDIRPLHPVFAGEVQGLDLRHPLDAAEVAAIEAGMDRFAVLVFPGQDIDNDQQVAFSRNFGEIELAVDSNVGEKDHSRLPVEFADVSNLDNDNKVADPLDRRALFGLGNRLWHSDSSFRVVPAKYSLLSARSIPSRGGNTEFADMRDAYDRLDEETKALVADLVCRHSLFYSRGKLGFDDYTEEEKRTFQPVRHPLLRIHPVTGRKSLYLSSHAGEIEGWPTPAARALLMDLTEAATLPDRVYVHNWRVHDLVMWDNRQTMHRARPFKADEKRDMRRTTIAGDGPTMDQTA